MALHSREEQQEFAQWMDRAEGDLGIVRSAVAMANRAADNGKDVKVTAAIDELKSEDRSDTPPPRD